MKTISIYDLKNLDSEFLLAIEKHLLNQPKESECGACSYVIHYGRTQHLLSKFYLDFDLNDFYEMLNRFQQ